MQSSKAATGLIINAGSAITSSGGGGMIVGQVGSTSQKAETGSTSGVISWTLSWTDSNGNAQSNIAQDLFQDGTAAPNTTFTTSAAGNYHMCRELDVNNAAAAIVVKWVGGGTTAAKVSATVERLI